MLSTFNEAYLFNESFAYHHHLSTNYFRNPLFEDYVNECEQQEGAGGNLYDNDVVATPQTDAGSNSSQSSNSLEFNSGWKKIVPLLENDDFDAKKRKQSVTSETEEFGDKKLLFYLAKKREQIYKFCDNITLTFRGKLFVMELNFKRRLGVVRRYFDKNMHWILPRRRSKTRPTDDDDERLRGGRFGLDWNGKQIIGKDDVADDANSFWRDTHYFPSPPKSSKCIGKQKEKILNRLELIKGISQGLYKNIDQLSCNQEAGSASSSNSDSCKFYNDLQHDDDVNDIDHDDGLGGQKRSRNVVSYGQACLWTQFGSSATAKRQQDVVFDEQVDQNGALSFKSAGSSSGGGCASNITTSVGDRSRMTCMVDTLAASKATTPTTTTTTTTTSTKRSSTRQQKLCIVCYENSPNIVTLPCKHNDICSDCFIEIIYLAVKRSQYPLKCVLCRQKIERIRCSRSLLLSVIERNRIK